MEKKGQMQAMLQGQVEKKVVQDRKGRSLGFGLDH
jgi:hypothetical protein